MYGELDSDKPRGADYTTINPVDVDPGYPQIEYKEMLTGAKTYH